jgi:hypothetical protein
MIDDDFIDYLDQWLQDQDVLMHSTTLERIEDGVREYVDGKKRSYSEWLNAPRGPDGRVSVI